MSTIKSKLIHPIPSKYTYSDIFNFHRTILSILSHKELPSLQVPELTTILHFTYLIIDLIDSPQIFKGKLKEDLQISNFSPSVYLVPKIKGLGAIGRSKKCLRELVLWMATVVYKEGVTLELLLDDYYARFPYALKPSPIQQALPIKPHCIKKTRNRVLVTVGKYNKHFPKPSTEVQPQENIIKPPD